MYVILDLPVANPSVLITWTLISFDSGLVRFNISCTTPLPSITLYVVELLGWIKFTIASVK